MLNVTCMREIYIFRGSVSFLNVKNTCDLKYSQLYKGLIKGLLIKTRLIGEQKLNIDQICQGLEQSLSNSN